MVRCPFKDVVSVRELILILLLLASNNAQIARAILVNLSLHKSQSSVILSIFGWSSRRTSLNSVIVLFTSISPNFPKLSRLVLWSYWLWLPTSSSITKFLDHFGLNEIFYFNGRHILINDLFVLLSGRLLPTTFRKYSPSRLLVKHFFPMSCIFNFTLCVLLLNAT